MSTPTEITLSEINADFPGIMQRLTLFNESFLIVENGKPKAILCPSSGGDTPSKPEDLKSPDLALR